MTSKILLAACLFGLMAGPALASKPSDADKLRQEAEHLCYDDVQKLCTDSIPDENKIKTCMKAHHGQLSPACAKVYDQGIGG